MEIKTKTCIVCKTEKSLNEFTKTEKGRLGTMATCKACRSSKRRAEYKANPEKYRAIANKWATLRREQIRISYKEYYNANREKLNIAKRKRNRKYRKDFGVRLNGAVSCGVNHALRGNKNGYHWEDLVGYTLNDLKGHLEKLFTEGMTWEKYGKGGWQIDHKIPVSVFNFTKPEHGDFKRCWALKNLQPMWEKENNSKRASIMKDFQPSLAI